MSDRCFIVLADDRTGAWETAGACADRVGHSVLVHVGATFHSAGRAGRAGSAGSVNTPETVDSIDNTAENMAENMVVDLGTRHLRADHAATIAAEAAALALSRTTRLLHKMDSTLRGNWADEVLGAASVHHRPVVVVPSFPAVGRTCRGGIVFDRDQPVHTGPAGRDPRRGVTTSRPAEHLRACGAAHVVELPNAQALTQWLRTSPSGIAVCDASTENELEQLGSAWAAHGNAVFVGTAASIAAAVGAARTDSAGDRARRIPLDVPALVVCGSLHPTAREQIDALRANAVADAVEVIMSDACERETVTAVEANIVAALLAEAVRQACANTQFSTIVILGGDTAAAILGDAPRFIEGTVGPGMPWTFDAEAVIVARPGGFGSDRSLIELFSARMER